MPIWSQATFIILLSLAPLAWSADFLPFGENSGLGQSRIIRINDSATGEGFIVPNEHYPAKARSIWSQSPSGIYISVGTERGFIGAAYSNATHLLLLDYDPEVVIFNRANTLLLKASSGLAQRLKAWRLNPQKALHDLATMDLLPHQKEWLKEVLNSAWWTLLSDKFRLSPFFERDATLIDSREGQFAIKNGFQDANYLNDQQTFKKLYQMAKNDRIQVEKINLANASSIQEVASALTRVNLKIAVLDLSNAWWEFYLGAERTRDLILQLAPHAAESSYVILTDRHISLQEDYHPLGWNYFFQTFKDLTQGPFSKMKFESKSELSEEVSPRYQYAPNRLMGFFQILGDSSCQSAFLNYLRMNHGKK